MQNPKKQLVEFGFHIGRRSLGGQEKHTGLEQVLRTGLFGSKTVEENQRQFAREGHSHCRADANSGQELFKSLLPSLKGLG